MAFIGALLGFLLSCLLLWLGKDWMLAGGYTSGNFEVSIWLFLRPAVFLMVLGVCLLSICYPYLFRHGMPLAVR